jgi:hypothetical protein
VKTLLGLAALGWAAIGAIAGSLYLLRMVAGSWETLGLWGVYLLGALAASLVAVLVGANIWYTEFMNPRDLRKDYRRFKPWLDKRAAAKASKALALKQDGQLSETQAGVGQVSMVGNLIGIGPAKK